MPFPKNANYIFMVITWGEEQHEAFGPYLVQADGSHLEQITDRMEQWRADHPDRSGMVAHLFATEACPQGRFPVAVPDPLSGQCPACLVPPGEPCYQTSTDSVRAEPHKLRALVAADRLEKCAHCGGLGWVPEDDTPDLETVP